MSKRSTDKLVEEFEISVVKRALATKDGAFSPHDKEIAEILYQAAKKTLLERLRNQSALIVQLSRSSH